MARCTLRKQALKSDQAVLVKRLLLTFSALLFSAPLAGCVVVGGTSRGGFFVWPGGFGLVLVILLIVLLLRRR